ncbi:MAG: hypothetical protein ACLR6O_00785 [Eubacterium sp.]
MAKRTKRKVGVKEWCRATECRAMLQAVRRTATHSFSKYAFYLPKKCALLPVTSNELETVKQQIVKGENITEMQAMTMFTAIIRAVS